MHHDSTKSVSVTVHGQVRECKLPSAPGEVPVDVFSDRGSTPLGSTTHSHGKWEINRGHAKTSVACEAWPLLVLFSGTKQAKWIPRSELADKGCEAIFFSSPKSTGFTGFAGNWLLDEGSRKLKRRKSKRD